MPLTEIERFLFEGKNLGHVVTSIAFGERIVRVEVRSIEPEPSKSVVALFSAATIESIEEDPEERASLPLDIIGFDSYKVGDGWRFVLNCGRVEWCWSSEWPSIED